MRIIFSLLLLLCLFGGELSAASSEPASSPLIVSRIIVPEPGKPQGEVQIIKQGDVTIVRTLLASPILKRVVAAIDNREARRWQQSDPNFTASIHYRDQLFEAVKIAWRKFTTRSNRDERRQFLGIDFSSQGRHGRISIYLPELDGDYGALQAVHRELLSEWNGTGDYIQQNMLAIVADSFGLEKTETATLLKQAAGKGE